MAMQYVRTIWLLLFPLIFKAQVRDSLEYHSLLQYHDVRHLQFSTPAQGKPNYLIAHLMRPITYDGYVLKTWESFMWLAEINENGDTLCTTKIKGFPKLWGACIISVKNKGDLFYFLLNKTILKGGKDRDGGLLAVWNRKDNSLNIVQVDDKPLGFFEDENFFYVLTREGGGHFCDPPEYSLMYYVIDKKTLTIVKNIPYDFILCQSPNPKFLQTDNKELVYITGEKYYELQYPHSCLIEKEPTFGTFITKYKYHRPKMDVFSINNKIKKEILLPCEAGKVESVLINDSLYTYVCTKPKSKEYLPWRSRKAGVAEPLDTIYLKTVNLYSGKEKTKELFTYGLQRLKRFDKYLLLYSYTAKELNIKILLDNNVIYDKSFKNIYNCVMDLEPFKLSDGFRFFYQGCNTKRKMDEIGYFDIK